MGLTNVWIIQLCTSITTECKADCWFPPVRQDRVSSCVILRYSGLLWPVKLQAFYHDPWDKTAHGSVADLWFSRRQILIMQHRHAPSSYKSSGCTSSWIHQDWMSCSVCRSHEALACAGPVCEPVSTRSVPLSCDPSVRLPWRPPAVARCCVPRLLVGFVSLHVRCLTGNFWEVHYPWGLAPSQIPSLTGTAQPSWREMPAANYTQVERARGEECAHLCLFACDSIHLCHRLH